MTEFGVQYRRATPADIRAHQEPRKAERFQRGQVLTAQRMNELASSVGGAPGASEGSRAPPRQLPGARGVGVFEARVLAHGDDFLECRILEGTPSEQSVLVAKPWLLRKTPHDEVGRGATTFNYRGSYFPPTDDDVESATPNVRRTAIRAAGQPDESHQIAPNYFPAGDYESLRYNVGFLPLAAPDGGPLGDPFVVTWSHPGDIIYVTNDLPGGLSIFRETFGSVEENPYTPEPFLDLNVDGRKWVTGGGIFKPTTQFADLASFANDPDATGVEIDDPGDFTITLTVYGYDPDLHGRQTLNSFDLNPVAVSDLQSPGGL